MLIQHNISLKPYNTFGVNVFAKHFTSITSVAELIEVLNLKDYPSHFILGGGSNMLLTKDINSLVIHINIKGIDVISENETHVIVKANAGENWHEFVLWCLKQNYGGVENLSLIPGNVGTAPIQNIGAYGVELKDTFYSCETLNIESKEIKCFNLEDCNFGYRESIFKQELKGKHIITSVYFKLKKTPHRLQTDYGAITSQLSLMDITEPTIKDVSNAVIAIRKEKLPDPNEIGNSGSFFKNPIISISHYKSLQSNFPNIPCYPISETEVKVPAGWLIEQSGFKGKTFGNFGVHKKQALVLVNYGNADGLEILKLARLIQNTVFKLFQINIETEVNII